MYSITDSTIFDILNTKDDVRLVIQQERARDTGNGSRSDTLSSWDKLDALNTKFTGHIRCLSGSGYTIMHMKTFIFCGLSSSNKPVPYAVWSGSLNPTNNGSHSLNEGFYITDHDIVKAVTSNFLQVYSGSWELAAKVTRT